MFGPALFPAKVRAGLEKEFVGAGPPEGFVDQRIAIWNQTKVATSIARESLRSNAELAAMSPRYHEITCPTFIAAQAQEPRRSEQAKRLHGEIAGSKLLLLDGTGHYVQVQKPAEVAAWIRQAAGVEVATASP